MLYCKRKEGCMNLERLKSIVGEEAVAELEKYSRMDKVSQESNILDNSMWSTMIDGALKALEIVSLASLDWKLVGIVKLLQSWLKDRREEKAQREMQYQTYSTTDPWDGGTTY